MSGVAAPADRISLAEVEQQLMARWPETKLDPSLDRIALLLEMLGRPETGYRAVHLTGTNGKTSTARMVDGLLAEAGVVTGRLTSPHLASVRERICLGGRPIDAAGFLATYSAVSRQALRVDACSPYSLSFFEMTVAMAYRAFVDHGVEIAVVEVGMGGRWDATNTIDADVAALLPVDLDHTDYLGPTVRHIAEEKAGIIKPGSLALSARQIPEVAEVLAARADEVGASLAVQDRDFAVTRRRVVDDGQVVSLRGLAGSYNDVPLSLHGPHQADNAALAVAAAEAALGRPLDPDAVRTALGRITSPGRLEVRPGSPQVVLDVAHNPHGARALARSLGEQGQFRNFAVVAVMADKEYKELLRELEPALDAVVCTATSSPRCLPAAMLAATAREVFGAQRVHAADDVASAMTSARDLANAPGGGPARVLVTGSVVTVAEARETLVAP